MKSATATTHGKAILIGEHSVVYDKTALALPIQNLNVTVRLTPINGNTSYIKSANINLDAPISTIEAKHPGLFYLLTHFESHQAFEATYISNIPTERGLGSSAATSLATIKALNDALALELSFDEQTAYANHAEELNHGSASGLDIATVCRDRLVYFDHGHCEFINQTLGAHLVIADSGVLGNTKKAVSLVKQQYQSSIGKAYIDDLTQLVKQTKALWQKQDIKKLGIVFNKAQTVLSQLQVSHPIIDQLIHTANVHGSLGSKLSGGGLGGIVISLAENGQTAEKISQALRLAGAKNTWIEEI
ncbi:mevalonate kinase [Holzapfeliella floricola]|uniref:mevalonate kinase n=1 Tax=Holzapfeliella floricola TaxID=679249 RepID=UPI00138F47BA|nr:mevalonate kinase [Holzapfeliella floricola]